MFNDYKRKMSSLSGQASDKAQSLTAEEVEQIGESFTDVYISGFKKFKSAVQDENAKTELDKYLSEGIEEDKEGFDLLGWWKLSSSRYPILSQMARNVLTIPASTVVSKNAFSAGGRVLDAYRTSLTPRMVQALICAKDWLCGSPISNVLEEDSEGIEKLDDGNVQHFLFIFFPYIVFFALF